MSCASIFPCFFPKQAREPPSQSQQVDPAKNAQQPPAPGHSQPGELHKQSSQQKAGHAESAAQPLGSQGVQPNDKPIEQRTIEQRNSVKVQPPSEQQAAVRDVPLQAPTPQKPHRNEQGSNQTAPVQGGESMHWDEIQIDSVTPSVEDTPSKKKEAEEKGAKIVVGEVGVLNQGAARNSVSVGQARKNSKSNIEVAEGILSAVSVFEPRATPRTVFKQSNQGQAPAHPHALEEKMLANSHAPAARPPAAADRNNGRMQPTIDEMRDNGRMPHVPEKQHVVSDWISMDAPDQKEETNQKPANAPKPVEDLQDHEARADTGTQYQSREHKPSVLTEYTQLRPDIPATSINGSLEGTVVRDGDEMCRAGTAVMIGEKWFSVAYFTQFVGLRGVLTRPGENGMTWYASFPGKVEQAFSTGMHGQYVLVYAPGVTNGAQKPGSMAAQIRAANTQISSQGESRAQLVDYPVDMVEGPKATLVPNSQHDQQRYPGPDSQDRNDVAMQVYRMKEEERMKQLQEQAAAEHAAQQLQPQNKDAVQDAAIAFQTDAPLAAPRAGAKKSARGPDSARIKNRPPSARSRSQMGAPPLGSARLNSARMNSARMGSARMTPSLSARRQGSATPDLASPRDDLTPESPREGGREGRLFKYPEWVEYELFDSDDLWSEHSYLLYGESMGAGQLPSVYVWVGQYFEECHYDDDASCDRFALRAAGEFRRFYGGNVPMGPITVVKEMEEEEDFWEYFVLG